MATFEAAESGSAGVLGLVSELATGVSDAARTLVKGRPDGFRAGTYQTTGGDSDMSMCRVDLNKMSVGIQAFT